MSNHKHGTLYVGVTNSLLRRLDEHQSHMDSKSFTARYGLNILIHWEPFETITGAITREKQLKKWKREWKIKLIEEHNPTWKDLSAEFRSLDSY